jgi:hypothetical protein
MSELKPILQIIYRGFLEPNRKWEAVQTIKLLLETFDGDTPPDNWYKLYEGLVGSHMELKMNYKQLQKENKKLREEVALLNEQVNEKFRGAIPLDDTL